MIPVFNNGWMFSSDEMKDYDAEEDSEDAIYDDADDGIYDDSIEEDKGVVKEDE